VNNLYEQYGLKNRCTIVNGVFTWTNPVSFGDVGDVDMGEPETTPEAASSSNTG